MASIGSDLPDDGNTSAASLDRAAVRAGPVPELSRFADRHASLRIGLIHYFRGQRALDPEMLADEVLFRTLQRILRGVSIDTSLEGYCTGVAKLILLEICRKPLWVPIPPEFPSKEQDALSRLSAAETAALLRHCMGSVPADELAIWLRYHREDRHQLAKELNISENALRIRVYRTRKNMIEEGRRLTGRGDLK
jgi:DNA-directed RNA polymerase specialized sigma24 family protein